MSSKVKQRSAVLVDRCLGMDTRAPPILHKNHHQQDKFNFHNKFQNNNNNNSKKDEVTLPPLNNFAAHRQQQQQHRSKFVTSPNWKNKSPPPLVSFQDLQRRRPYKVLSIGATPLMHACQQADRPRVLKLLREQEETICYRDRSLRSALHYCMDAATGGAVAAAAPELVNAPDAEGHTPLHLAVIAGDTQLVAVLLANGADVNAKDHEGHSILHWATVCGEVECVRLLLAAGARPSTQDYRGGTPLHYAAQCCGAAATSELSVPKKIGLSVLQTLLDFGADVNSKDEDGRQPILWAASAGSVEAVLALVRSGGPAIVSSSDKDGLTALHCAASRGHARCIEALVNLCDAQPDHVDDNGCSALHYAATLGHADATALLLKLAADPNRQDRKGRTPALCAAAKGQLETLKILILHGASLYARTVRGTGIAHEAVTSGRTELIKWLSKKRVALLDASTQDGKTPLHVAALHGHLDMCKLLLDHGVRINAVLKTSKGSLMTPLDAALHRGHRDCAKLIQLHGGMTARHLKLKKTGSSQVFSKKLGAQCTETSTDSELSNGPKRLQPGLYLEERWIERRMRRRANRNQLSKEDSRSFSEEELRMCKGSKADVNRVRRALSENARYNEDLSDVCGTEIATRKGDIYKRSRNLSKNRKFDIEKAFSDFESEDKYSLSDDERSSSVSDDSLEVLVVKKSLEKTEKIVSERKSKSYRNNLDEISKVKKMYPDKETKRIKRSTSKPGGKFKRKGSSLQKKSQKVKDTERDAIGTSPESSDKITTAADVHENQKNSHYFGEDKDSFDPDVDESMKSKMDDILEKADELQSTLLAKAADLKKDMEEMKQQISKMDDTNKKTEKHLETSDSGVKEEKRSSISKHSDGGTESKRPSLTKESEAGSGSKRSSLTKQTEEINASSKRSSVTNEQGQQECPSIVINSGESPESRRASMANSHEDHPGSKRSSFDNNNQIEAPGSKRTSLDNNENLGSKRSSLVHHEESESTERREEGDYNAQSQERKRSSEIGVDEGQPRSQRSSFQADEHPSSKRSSTHELEETPGSKRNSFDKKVEDGQGSKRPSFIQITDDQTESHHLELPSEAQQGSSQQSEDVQNEKRHSIMKTSEHRKSSKVQESQQRSGSEAIRFSEDTSYGQRQTKRKSHPSVSKRRQSIRPPSTDGKFKEEESSEEHSPDHSAIVAVIESSEWAEEDAKIAQEIRNNIQQKQPEEGESEVEGGVGLVKILPSTSEEEATAKTESLPQLHSKSSRSQSPRQVEFFHRHRQRRDSGGKDSGIEPSPRISRIPRRTLKCYPNTEKTQNLHIDTITRDVQINIRRYHLERKIFFQLMELKRLQIRHGKTNEHVLVKRQVEAFHKAGMSGPAIGVARYDQPLTFRHFESFLYEQLRRLQKRPTTPEWCKDAKYCTQKTHRCHHATSAYTSLPIYTYHYCYSRWSRTRPPDSSSEDRGSREGTDDG